MMTKRLSPEILEQLSSLMAEQVGLHYPRPRWRDLEKGLQAAAVDLDFPDASALAQHLFSAPLTKEVVEILAGHLTINETYFFRDRRIFEILEWEILPPLLAARRSEERRLRIWSAGCASGEEAYSLAILLLRVLPDPTAWQITLLATDISQRALRKAEQGVFSQWSFRGVPAWLREKYFFRVQGEHWEINPRLKEMVTFSYLNLATDPFPSLINNTSAMDIIFCRNVLMYFTPSVIQRALANFSAALVDEGWLMVSPAECALLQGAGLVACSYDGAILFQKRRQRQQPPAFRPAKALAPPERPGFLEHPRDPECSRAFPSNLNLSGSALAKACDPGFEKTPARRPAAAQPHPVIAGPIPSDRPSGPGPLLPRVRPDQGETTAKVKEGSETRSGIPKDATVRRPGLSAGDGGEAQALALMAHACASQGRLEEARIWGEKAIAQDRLNARHYYLLASICQEQGRSEDAMTLLKQALYLETDFILAHFSLGNLARQQGRHREAQKHFDNVLALLEESPDDGIIPGSEGLTVRSLREMTGDIRHGFTGKKKPAATKAQ